MNKLSEDVRKGNNIVMKMLESTINFNLLRIVSFLYVIGVKGFKKILLII